VNLRRRRLSLLGTASLGLVLELVAVGRLMNLPVNYSEAQRSWLHRSSKAESRCGPRSMHHRQRRRSSPWSALIEQFPRVAFRTSASKSIMACPDC